jgi:hypothetical protein
LPNRIIKESICVSDDINNLSWFAEVLFYRLMVNCDDYGLFDGRPAIVKNKLFPLKENLTISTVSKAITELATSGLVMPYTVCGRPYLALPAWTKHQQIRAARPRYPLPEEAENEQKTVLETTCKQMISDDINGLQPIANAAYNPNPNPNPNTNKCTSTAGARTRTRARTVPVPIPKNVEEVAEYCKANSLDIDCQRFFDTYERQYWRLNGPNGSPIHDWRAIAKLWAQEKIDRSNNAGDSEASFDTDEFFARALAGSYARMYLQENPSLTEHDAFVMALQNMSDVPQSVLDKYCQPQGEKKSNMNDARNSVLDAIDSYTEVPS